MNLEFYGDKSCGIFFGIDDLQFIFSLSEERFFQFCKFLFMSITDDYLRDGIDLLNSSNCDCDNCVKENK